ncbi:signal peptidase I [Listeria booriae]|uniref:signal peptidase I n=1 Tax=Listeria booriae TaxID=1552123 RepID=UPI001623FFF7|nr:signal peptidase I [Listeria booriae]MBC1228294.1 signal peptidase I [Listeria booriae]MBC2365897.1 signal peptidase I [Listeria booriae]
MNKQKIIFGVILCLGIIFCINKYLYSLVMVNGDSMNPSLTDGELKLMVKSKIGNINRFDIIVFQDTDSSDLMIKRVIGLPQEVVQYKDNHLFVDGKLVYEDFIMGLSDTDPNYLTKNFSTHKITKNHYFVLGDNRQLSDDSRLYGTVNIDKIIGVIKYTSTK